MTIQERLQKASDLIAEEKIAEANILLVGEEAKKDAEEADALLAEKGTLLACKEAILALNNASIEILPREEALV